MALIQRNQPTSGTRRTERSSVAAYPTCLALGALSTLAACGGGGGGGADMDIIEVGNGFGPLLPHRAYKLDEFGEPTTQAIALRSLSDLYDNVTPENLLLPVASWDDAARLPDGTPGNHFLVARFTSPIDVDTVLDPDPQSPTSNLAGSVSVVALDPSTGESLAIQGRAFVNGKTYAGLDPGTGLLALEDWVGLTAGANGVSKPTALVPEALGFPGTQQATGFPGADDLVGENVFVFVVDSDGDLKTHETFPEGRDIRLRMTTGVRSTGDEPLVADALACSTVGLDELAPEVGILPSEPTSLPAIIPGNGISGVDPSTTVKVQFSEPVQPTTIGTLAAPNALPLSSSAVTIRFGPENAITQVPFLVRPVSIYDFSVIELLPTITFPGTGPDGFECEVFSRIDVDVAKDQIEDVNGNINGSGTTTFFVTGEGAPVVNAPVLPEAIVVGRTGSEPSLSVIDLNGFGGSTGNPTYDPFNPLIKGNSNFPNNPNVLNQGGNLRPPLAPGECTVNGGSAGVFTLTKGSDLNDKLLRAPELLSVGDMMIGQPLDLTFNNGPPPFGCQSGTFNVCATNGLKQPNPVIVGPHSLGPSQPGQFGVAPAGSGNLISWAPHPNPPPLSFPPTCFSPYIGGQEPTGLSSVDSAGNPLQNLLAPNGDPFGNPNTNPPTPPTGLLASEQNTYFQGPVFPPPSSVQACVPYQIRQQIGHFLYVIDQVRNEVVVVNSNTFRVIDRVIVPDPTSLAMSPNLDLLAVTSRTSGQVFFIDIDPSSPTFHTVTESVEVGFGPSGIAWQPDNEDIIVCNEGSNSVTIISAFDLQVRKTLLADLNSPFEVVVTERQTASGLARRVYYAFILGRNGRVALFESGPDGAQGLGADQILGQAPFTFDAPKQMQRDQVSLNGGVWILHENVFNAATDQPSGATGGAVSNLVLESSIIGQIVQTTFGVPTLQQKFYTFDIKSSVGPGVLTGVPVDLAFDNLTNLGGLTGPVNADSGTSSIPVNSKHSIRSTNFGLGAVGANDPNFMFLAVPNSNQAGGVIDVINLAGGLSRFDTDVFLPGVQSIPVTGARVLTDYWRQ